MKIFFSKYQGAGNDFVILDNRNHLYSQLTQSMISKLCDRKFGIGSDGLMLLESNKTMDFTMRYFNSDGKEASMCGNGGRCIVAFARDLGIIDKATKFMAVDGEHKASLHKNIITLKMSDVNEIKQIDYNFFLDTGSPHYIIISENIKAIDVKQEGAKHRYSTLFSPEGTNVNFISYKDDKINIRTYERGVEDETLACGTGITAAALTVAQIQNKEEGCYYINASGGKLEVSFKKHEDTYYDIYLKGPAEFVFEGEIVI